jgi:hypothetical protein
MIPLSPSAAHGVEAYRPLLDMLESVLITPKQLGEHWRYSPAALAGIRMRGAGLPFVKLRTGGVRYRLSDVAAAELQGTGGPLTVDRVVLALAACSGLSVEQRAIAQNHVRCAFGGAPTF